MYFPGPFYMQPLALRLHHVGLDHSRFCCRPATGPEFGGIFVGRDFPTFLTGVGVDRIENGMDNWAT